MLTPHKGKQQNKNHYKKASVMNNLNGTDPSTRTVEDINYSFLSNDRISVLIVRLTNEHLKKDKTLSKWNNSYKMASLNNDFISSIIAYSHCFILIY